MSGQPTRVALIGYGAIGRSVLELIESTAASDLEIVGVLVRQRVEQESASGVPFVLTIDDLMARAPDVVVEAAGHAALRAYGPGVLRAGADLVLVSVGALADPAVMEAIVTAAEAGNARARVASGAVGALDALAAAAVGGLSRVTHTTRKPARALLPPEEADQLTEAREVYRGSARDAALRFPESVNVAAAVSLAGCGFDRTEVRVVADPDIDYNHHEVVVEGRFGTFRFDIRNIPSAANPKSAQLAAMSIVHALRRPHAVIQIG